MNLTDSPSSLLPQLRLRRLGPATEAGLWITSLPAPRQALGELEVMGQPAYRQEIGQWSGEATPAPRRLLLIADGANRAPEELHLSAGICTPPLGHTPRAEMELFASSTAQELAWERHLLRLHWGEASVGLTLGLRVKGEIHWWEACRMVVLEETPTCLVVEMGGAIPHTIMTPEEFREHRGLSNPFLHRHNWVNGRLYVRMHSNGVCEVFAHHINSKFFDEGADLSDCVPVIGLQAGASTEAMEWLSGSWDGSVQDLQIGNVRFDLTEAARLATPRQPGRMEVQGAFLVWQPYQGVELFGGTCPEQRTGDPCIFRAEHQLMPRGMARTVNFSFSVSDRSPRVVRYLAPAWWYGLCEEFLPAPYLPVSGEYDSALDKSRAWVREHLVQGGFEDGALPRHTQFQWEHQGTTRYEPGWEGEIPYAQFLAAWRSGEAEDYSTAMRAATYFTDVVIDHASKTARMHGYGPPACSLPMNRMQGTIAAYLETGDPYFLDVAQAVTQNSYWQHKNSWPRLAIGRDACFIRSAVLLYRYFATDFFREIAHEAALHTVQSQRPNGSFGDQGGGTGVHQWAGYISKPWMGLLALNGVLDYLELFPNEPVLLEGVRRFANWLMAERFDHDGVVGWSYQHDYNGGRDFYDPTSGNESSLPTASLWHQDTLARFLNYCAIRFNDISYREAWLESFAGAQHMALHDHQVAAQLQFLPWVQSSVWKATWNRGQLQVAPLEVDLMTAGEVAVATPCGPISLTQGQQGASH